MATVSFDFDFTLWDEFEQMFIFETLSILREHVAKGDRVIVTTSRVEKWIPETKGHLARVGVHADVFSAPGNADDPHETDLTKSDVLIRENAIFHMDDDHESSSLQKAREVGIEIRFPPAIRATVARIY